MSPFVLLFVQNFLYWSAMNSGSLLPSYLASLGASQTFIGFFNVIGVVVVLIVILFFSRPLVKLPRVRTLRWGYALLVAAFLLSWALPPSLPVLAALRLIAAVSQAFASTLMVSLLFDQVPADRRAGSLALFSVAGMLTNPVGSLAGEFVLSTFGGSALFLLGAAFGLVAWGWSFLLKEPRGPVSEEEPHTLWRIFTRKGLRSLLAVSFAFGIFYSALMAFLPHHTQLTLGAANLSAFVVPFSVISVVMRVFLGRQLDRRPPRRFLYLSFLALLLSAALLLLPPQWAWIALAGTLYGLGHSVLYPLLNTLVVNVGGEDQKATYSNAFVVCNLLGAITTTPLLGIVSDTVGFVGIAATLAVVALGCFVVVRRRFPRPTAGQPSAHSS